MATVTFGGNTLWSDASNGGVGSVAFADRTLENLSISRPLPRAYGSFLKAGGRASVMLPVAFTKQFSAQSGEATFRAALEALMDDTLRTLTVTGHGAISNCRLVSAQAEPTRPFQVGATLYQLQDWFLIFERMR